MFEKISSIRSSIIDNKFSQNFTNNDGNTGINHQLFIEGRIQTSARNDSVFLRYNQVDPSSYNYAYVQKGIIISAALNLPIGTKVKLSNHLTNAPLLDNKRNPIVLTVMGHFNPGHGVPPSAFFVPTQTSRNVGLFDLQHVKISVVLNSSNSVESSQASRPHPATSRAKPAKVASVQPTNNGVSNLRKKLLDSANRNIKIYKNIDVQCANSIRDVFREANIAIGVTRNPWDAHLVSGINPALASSFFGDDIGTRIERVEDLKPGDLIAFRNTYGNWPKGTITHVAIFAGLQDGIPYMYDHTFDTGFIKEPMDRLMEKFIYGVRPYVLK